ncbi:MAG: tetratricopeptide repeat protein [Pirellulales bacterium]|nr:tetratricopeptide repeat protein [Pirellulales bacterium]
MTFPFKVRSGLCLLLAAIFAWGFVQMAAAQDRSGLPIADVSDAVSWARQSYSVRDYKTAVNYFEIVVSATPNDAESWFFLGRSFHQMRMFPQALEAYQEAARALRYKPLALYQMARVYSLENDAQKALDRLRSAIKAGYRASDPREDEELVSLRDAAEFADLALAARPAGKRPEYRQLDFWRGDWTIHDFNSGEQLAESSTEATSGTFLMLESWQSAGAEYGRRICYYNANETQWVMSVVCPDRQMELSGGIEDGVLAMKGRMRKTGADEIVPVVLTVVPNDGSLEYLVKSVPADGQQAKIFTHWQYRRAENE